MCWKWFPLLIITLYITQLTLSQSCECTTAVTLETDGNVQDGSAVASMAANCTPADSSCSMFGGDPGAYGTWYVVSDMDGFLFVDTTYTPQAFGSTSEVSTKIFFYSMLASTTLTDCYSQLECVMVTGYEGTGLVSTVSTNRYYVLVTTDQTSGGNFKLYSISQNAIINYIALMGFGVILVIVAIILFCLGGCCCCCCGCVTCCCCCCCCIKVCQLCTEDDTKKRRKGKKKTESYEQNSSTIVFGGNQTLMYQQNQGMTAPSSMPFDDDDDPFATVKREPATEMAPTTVFQQPEQPPAPAYDPMPIPGGFAEPTPNMAAPVSNDPIIIQQPAAPAPAPQPNINVSLAIPGFNQMPQEQPVRSEPIVNNVVLPPMATAQSPMVPMQSAMVPMQSAMVPMQSAMVPMQSAMVPGPTPMDSSVVLPENIGDDDTISMSSTPPLE